MNAFKFQSGSKQMEVCDTDRTFCTLDDVRQVGRQALRARVAINKYTSPAKKSGIGKVRRPGHGLRRRNVLSLEPTTDNRQPSVGGEKLESTRLQVVLVGSSGSHIDIELRPQADLYGVLHRDRGQPPGCHSYFFVDYLRYWAIWLLCRSQNVSRAPITHQGGAIIDGSWHARTKPFRVLLQDLPSAVVAERIQRRFGHASSDLPRTAAAMAIERGTLRKGTVEHQGRYQNGLDSTRGRNDLFVTLVDFCGGPHRSDLSSRESDKVCKGPWILNRCPQGKYTDALTSQEHKLELASPPRADVDKTETDIDIKQTIQNTDPNPAPTPSTSTPTSPPHIGIGESASAIASISLYDIHGRNRDSPVIDDGCFSDVNYGVVFGWRRTAYERSSLGTTKGARRGDIVGRIRLGDGVRVQEYKRASYQSIQESFEYEQVLIILPEVATSPTGLVRALCRLLRNLREGQGELTMEFPYADSSCRHKMHEEIVYATEGPEQWDQSSSARSC
ncbi:uncharacterized protein STEHIDRAFT_112208 [Stereum hirsutum FP-91666 SS1]|uniref:uncharacterized protein n=1 Tax=Stereum hirsutum (strain FP-91666) TaxID=721885 RepID=UPI00044494F3|nr:uncharacterized protein STEHIDRAFT_112208 [Stereum hirsutum FP-91666 SS1]EIM85700.1 hypothetical protein STEHIDRAFT_112208 [Stereum hirsutum FP-91666 SS1]